MAKSGQSPTTEPQTGERRIYPNHEMPSNRVSTTAKEVSHDLGPVAIFNNSVQKVLRLPRSLQFHREMTTAETDNRFTIKF